MTSRELQLEGVEYMHPSDYFRRCWGDCGPVLDLFESLEAAKQVAAAKKETCETGFQYPAHLGASALDDALSSGNVLQVQLSRIKHIVQHPCYQLVGTGRIGLGRSQSSLKGGFSQESWSDDLLKHLNALKWSLRVILFGREPCT